MASPSGRCGYPFEPRCTTIRHSNAKTWAFSTTPEGIVLPEFKKNTNIGVGIGIVLQIVGKVLSNDGMVGIGFVVLLAGAIVFIWGCGQYAKAKGYSPWFGLLGLLSILGLIALVFFPDKHKDA
jgi:hypothetical protein